MKKWILLSSCLLATSVSYADGFNFAGNATNIDPSMHDGLFIGIGANFNSLNLTQNSWGEGISNIVTATTTSNGIAQGNGAPFNNISNSLAPGLQVGYFKHLYGSPNLFGLKFSYQYLGETATNNALYIPQIGETTNAATGVVSPLYGYVNAASIQVTINHQLTFLGLIGRSFGNVSLYLGAGPALVNLKSKNYNSIGYADVQGETINVTGLITYDTPSTWVWAGAAEIGASYFFSPTWFIDMAYSYVVTGSTTFNHQQPFSNSGNTGGVPYTTLGTIITKNTISAQNQTIMFSINKLFDF